MGVGKDRISELHDSLLHYIFSCLPIKCVVATSTLSKRWKNLCMSIPAINICEWQPSLKANDKRTIQTVQFQDTKRLVSFLDRMILPTPPLLPIDMPTIKKFRLDYCCCDYLFDNSRIYDWISTLVMRKIEELCLCLRRDFLLPPCLFTYEILSVLEIEMAGNLSSKNRKAGNLGFPPMVSFSR
ncbi:hypothetical protein MKX01_027304 [Papaver californicum]|nr:hypothetical protein MKX01_027304 [Papaver californicum]